MNLHYETAGDGPALLLVHGGGEDAGMLEPLGRELAARGFRAIWYDRRGTGRSTRADWPGSGADQHADDAAALLESLGATGGAVVGFSSGGTVALALAARHPSAAAQVIAWEPAALGMLPDGAAIRAQMTAPADAYLAGRPGDWAGAFHVTLDVLSEGRADHDSPEVKAMTVNAEAMVRDDSQFVGRGFVPGELPADRVRVAVSEVPNPLHAAIADSVAGLLGGTPEVVRGADDHEIYLTQPAVMADYLARALLA